jgi:hypothetical protein
VHEDPRSGHSKMYRRDANVDRVQILVRSDLSLGARLRAKEFNMGISSEEQTQTMA